MSAQTQNRSVQFINYPTDKKPFRFAFLSKPPPPPQKFPSGPTVPLPLSPNAYSSIIAWASLVQPGSPAPLSPQSVASSRRSSFTRRPSISQVGHNPKTPSVGDFDLTALGYTSVFVHLAKTPTTPSPYLRQRSTNPVEFPTTSLPVHEHIPIPPMPSQEQPVKRTGFSRFRSLSILPSRSSKPNQQPSVTTTPPKPSKPTKSKKHSAPTESCSATTIAKTKRAKYAIPPPPPLHNDLAMMQFMDGGSIESHAKRVMESQAKAAAGSGPHVGVGDVYRDGNGGLWWDADEEWEYTHLLADPGAATAPIPKTMAIDWEDFGTTEPFYLQINKEIDPLSLERRESVSSLDSDLDPKYLLTVPEHTPSGFNAPVEDRVLGSHKIGGPGMSILCQPSRPRRKAMHLNKTEFLVDIAAFGPRSPIAIPFNTTKPKPKGPARRRPAPLKLAHQTQNAVVVVRRPVAAAAKTLGVESVEKVRKDFIADSFAPIPTTTTTTYTKTNTTTGSTLPPPPAVYTSPLPIPAPQQIMNKKPSRRNMRGLFTRRVD